MHFSVQRIGAGNKYKDKKEFLVISFWFLDEIASVVSLHRNDRKER